MSISMRCASFLVHTRNFLTKHDVTLRNKRYIILVVFTLFLLLTNEIRIIITEQSLRRIPLVLFELSDISSTGLERVEFQPLGAIEEKLILQSVAKKILPPESRCTPYNLTDNRRNYFSQYEQDEQIERIFRSKREGFFIEAGGHTGEEFSNTLYFERNLEWTGLLVEPLKTSFQQLMQKRRKSYAIQTCLATSNRPQNITLSYRSDDSSAVASTLTENISQEKVYLVKEQITCYPLWSMLANLYQTTIDYFSLDIEGMEMKVLQSIPWDRLTFKVIMIEVNHFPEGKRSLRSFMDSKGYVFLKRVEIDYIFYNKMFAGELNLE